LDVFLGIKVRLSKLLEGIAALITGRQSLNLRLDISEAFNATEKLNQIHFSFTSTSRF